MKSTNPPKKAFIRPAGRLTGIGEYYFSAKLRDIAERNADGAGIINLGIGSPDLPPPEQVVDRLWQGARQLDAHGYQPYRGLPALRSAFSEWYRRHFRSALDPETEILPLLGSKEGIMHISMAFLDPGDEVLVPDPGYPAYRAASLLAGAGLRTYPLSEPQGWLPDLDLLARQDLSQVKIMWINYPHMPTGAVADPGFFSALVSFAHAHRLLLVNDNPYALLGAQPPLSLFQRDQGREVGLELHSLSKSHNMAGWRIGMLCGREDFILPVLRLKSQMDSGMFRPVQEAAAEALALDADWYEPLRAVYSGRRALVRRLLETLGCRLHPAEQVGLFLWARVPEAWKDGYALSDWLLEQAGVFLAPGGIFGPQGQGYIRASLCRPEPEIENALHRIESAHAGREGGSDRKKWM